MRIKAVSKYFCVGPLNRGTGTLRRGEKENPAAFLGSWVFGTASFAAQAMPPLDNWDLVSRAFRALVDLLAGTDALTFRVLLKTCLSGAITCGVLFWLWREGWREKIIVVPVTCVGFFVGLWIPVAWLNITIPTLKAFIVLLLILGLFSLSVVLPFFFTRHASRQVTPRLMLLGGFAVLVVLQILLSRHGH